MQKVENYDAAVFKVFGQNFLYSAGSLTYYPITECARTILTKKAENLKKKLLEKFSEREVELTFKKLEEFKKAGVLVPPRSYPKGEIYYGDYILKLVQSTRCNLNCSYCFARKSADYDMSVETAKKAILLFLDYFVPDENRRFIIDLTGSGEPLLRLDFIFEVNDFVLKLKKERNINIFCQLATNGMLLDKKTSSLLKKKNILFGVSLDGKKEATEKNRLGLDYDLVSKNINEMENKDFFGIAATYTGKNHDFIEIFKNLYSFKPEVVGMRPVRLLESDENSINPDNVDGIIKSYEAFVKWMYKELTEGNGDYFRALMGSEDYFTMFLKATIHPLRLFYRCSAGINSFAVDGKENIIICPAFIGKEEGIVGNLETGFDWKKKVQLEKIYADKIEECKNCWARYTCAGECLALSNKNGKAFGKPMKAMCKLKKNLIALAVYFWTALRYEHEDIYGECLKKY